MKTLCRPLLIGLCCLLDVPAQWPTNPALNLPVGDAPGDQAVPKEAATPDGGAYIAWFDHASGNYDVRLQRLDANGYEAWPHQGILVSGNPQSTSLVDWDLIADSAGNAVVTFTDVRAGGDLDVYAYRIDPAGAFLWGGNGVALSADATYEANPVVAEMSDGTFVFAWSRSVSGATARLGAQRLDASGAPLLGATGIEITGGPTDDPGFVGILAAPGGAFILSWIRDITPFSSPKHLWTQKYDAAGSPLWGAAPVVVYDAASLPIAFRPELVSDGQGGAWHAWHVSVGSFFQGRVQHIDANGVEVFPHNGVEASLEPSRSEFNPSLAPLAGTGDVIVFYNKRNSGQSLWGIGGQRISATGQLLWGPGGIEYVPYDATPEEAPRAVPSGNGAFCFVEQGNFTTTIVGLAVDAAGAALWNPSPIPVSSTVSAKDKLRAVAASDGTAILCWSDARGGTNDIYSQNVEPDGSLGAPPALAAPYGCGLNPAGSLVVVAGAPSIGTVLTLGVGDPGATMPAGAATALAVALLPDPAFPCGLVLPGIGLAAPGAAGEILVDLGSLILPLLAGPAWAGPGLPSPYPFALPPAPALVGLAVHAQGALVDPVTGRVGVTNGLRIRFGP